MPSLSSTIRDPSAGDVTSGFALLFISWYIATAVSTWYRLRHVPGPFLASFSYLWLAINVSLGRADASFEELKKYGPVVRVGPKQVVTSDPETLRRIAGARTRYGKDAWYRVAKPGPGLEGMMSTLDNGAHDRLKARTAAAYSGRENPDLEVAVDQQIEQLKETIRRYYDDDGGAPKNGGQEERRPRRGGVAIVDFATLCRRFTLDVITRLGYGQPFGFLEDENLHGYISSIDTLTQHMNLVADIPLFAFLTQSSLFMRFFAPRPTDNRGIGKFMGIAQQVIDERFQEGRDGKEGRDDMLGSFMRHGMTQEECNAEIFVQIFAGSDTSATVIRVTMMYLMATPRVYLRLKKEIRDCLQRGEASSPITVEQAQKLPYLQAVIWEGFRMKNPLIYSHYKSVPPGGDTVHGIFLPEGTALGHNTRALTRDETIFGEDVEVFRPERFLECEEAQKRERERALDIVFGGGRWMCAGKPIALMELNKVYFELLRTFDFQLIDPSKAWDEFVVVTYLHKNMGVRITEAEM